MPSAARAGESPECRHLPQPSGFDQLFDNDITLALASPVMSFIAPGAGGQTE
jgi:hypothetical protein